MYPMSSLRLVLSQLFVYIFLKILKGFLHHIKNSQLFVYNLELDMGHMYYLAVDPS